MKNRKQIRGDGVKLLLWGISAFFAMLILITVLSCVWYVHVTYEKYADKELYRTEAYARSPQFWSFQFTDRQNRVGEAVDVTAKIYAQKQTAYVSFDEIPRALVDAFVAIEDKRFWEHEGVDWYRTLAAGANYLLGFSDTFGASTITQQLVKNMTGKDQLTLKRKLQEIFYALDLEKNLDKNEIMELYLNVIHFSDQCNGIAAAAEHYYSKTPCELSISECATIAAITNNPAYYNPIRHPQNNLYRRNLILSEMHAQGYLTDLEYQNAKNTPLELRVDEKSAMEGINSWYTDMVIEDVISDLQKEYGMSRAAASHLLYTGGLRIDIAMDEEVQKAVEDYYHKRIMLPSSEDGTRAQSALIVIDSHTGDILGVAGAAGEKHGNHLQNFATQTKRSPGSTIKPISVYAPALERGLIHYASAFDDVPVNFGTNGRNAWPKNASGVYRGLTNVAYAVSHSTNTVSVRVLEQLGLRNAFRYAKENFHLSSMIDRFGESDCDLAALALGQLHYGVTLRELTNAYTVFADGGVYHPCRSYYRVLDADGNILLSNPDHGEVVLSRANADLMTKLLEGVVQNGTSGMIDFNHMSACAGKTGTTNRDCDRWFVGYTPDLVCGVWSGYEYPQPMEGKNVSVRIWNDVMTQLYKTGDYQTAFSVSSELVCATYCKDSGKLMTDACAKDPRGARSEVGWFVRGTEPTEFCDCHVLCSYDVQNGGINHGFCPEETIEEVGLIRVSRHFPKQVRVLDAQYVYGGSAEELSPNPNSSQSYFANATQEWYIGDSAVEFPYHRSCPIHVKKEETEEKGLSDPEVLPIPWGVPPPLEE